MQFKNLLFYSSYIAFIALHDELLSSPLSSEHTFFRQYFKLSEAFHVWIFWSLKTKLKLSTKLIGRQQSHFFRLESSRGLQCTREL